MNYIGIDNGVTSSLAIVNGAGVLHFGKMPTKSDLNYQKSKVAHITRIDVVKLRKIFSIVPRPARVYLERPMVNPGRFTATTSALRALEAVLICIEDARLPFQYIDSKEWQKALLPSGCKGDDLKTASFAIGARIFPAIVGTRHPDADGLLIAEYARRFYGKEKEGYDSEDKQMQLFASDYAVLESAASAS